MLNSEYIPDYYIIVGEQPEHFPIRLRKYAFYRVDYKNFDGIKVVDKDYQSSYYKGRIC